MDIKPTHEKPDDSSFLSKLLRFVAFPVAGVSGYYASLTEVRNKAHQVARQTGVLDDIDPLWEAQRKANAKLRVEGAITETEHLLRDRVNRAGHRAALDARMEYMGLGGFLPKLNYISRSSKQRALIDGMTVAGISLGALLTIANSKSITTLFSDDTAEEPQQPPASHVEKLNQQAGFNPTI
jgi:hypothetical protein